ncbi:hypothetical protein SISNIDRAFT_274334 [Sistotremastrum niveocremeum HHB9708]|uniref:Uncharacterized protein n=1 Tax=Sistotremastrum niveocremeum HHB9708 TaxID=1314777 RepID=A0A164NWC5_9AGAM|nr:hypothetical protein SISNIDRAFT_274334 [Sistotremastrum niveocremeum HHB9708]
MRQNMSSNVPISNYGQSMQMSSQAPQSLGQNSADHPFLYSSSSSASSQEYASGSPTRTGSGGTRGSRSHRFTPYPGSNPHGQIDIAENQLGSYQSTGMPNSGNGYHFPPNQQLHHGDIHDSVEASVQHSSSGLSLPPLTVPSSLSSSSGTQYSARPYSRDKDWDRERAWEREKEYADSTNYSLPPISSLATTNRASGGDSAAVLKRLSVQTEGARMTGEVSYQTSDVPSGVNLGRRRSLSEPVLPM